MRTRAAALLVGLVLGVAVAGCGRTIQPPPNPNALPASQGTPSVVFGTPPAGPAGPGVHIAGVADFAQPFDDTPARLCGGTLVVLATISAYGPAHWNSPDGTRPAAYTDRDLEEHGYQLYTPLQFSYWRVLLDHRAQPTTQYVMMGGQVGNDSYQIHLPHPSVGQLYILLFVPGQGIAPTANGPLVLARNVMVVYGAVPIDAQLVAHFPDRLGLGALQEPLSQVESQLASCPTTQ